MKTILVILGLVGLVAPKGILASEALSPEQILCLMEASRSRYLNMEATIREQTFQNTANSPTPILQGSTNFTIRMTPERRYVNMDMRTPQDQRINKTDQYVITTGYAKQITVDRKRNKTSGLIDRPEKLRDTIHVHSPIDAVWGLQNVPWSMIHQRIQGASISKERDLYVLEFRYDDSDQSSGLRIWIDPEKGYVPVSHAVIVSDKTMLSRVDTLNWNKMDNLWIPMAYTYSAPGYGFRQEFEVQSIALNQPISNDRLDFVYPEGTIVDDRLRGMKYPAPKTNSQQVALAVEMATPLALPASEVDLDRVATKSDEMMALQQAESLTPTQIELSPAFVWILPGKNQYSLKLSPGKAKPILTDRSFQADDLTLWGVDDLLADTGTILVTLERPEGHKAFADAVLTLDFAGTKVPIHFVAAPLPE
jgi:hypothetical protein